jgi:predicted lipoprotein with Yx(FWY)xxD motif
VTGTVLIVLCSVLAGCTTGGAGAPEPVVTTAATSALATVTGLFTVDSSTLGQIVVDGRGFVLYRSDRDSARPTRSTCTGTCLKQWLPAMATGDLQIAGIDRELVGRFTRPDGTVQLTLAGWPLYGFAEDRMPGDVNGQGSNGVWHVIAPSGGKAG